MFKKAHLTIALVMALVLAITVATPAFADPPTPPPGTPAGFTYLYTCLHEDRDAMYGAGTYIWWYSPGYVQYLKSHPDDDWFWPTEEVGRCQPAKEPTEMDLTAGQTYDIYFGNCGVNIQVASTYGTATVSRVAKTGIFAFAHDPCQFSFVNNAGESVSNFGAPVTYYFNLSHNLYQKYENGKIGLFVNDGSGWVQCSAMLVGVDLENGDYGRLACTVNAVGRFALGYVK